MHTNTFCILIITEIAVLDIKYSDVATVGLIGLSGHGRISWSVRLIK